MRRKDEKMRWEPGLVDAIDLMLSGRMDRRHFIRRAAVLGLSVSATAALLEACGSGSAPSPIPGTSAATSTTGTAVATPPVGSAQQAGSQASSDVDVAAAKKEGRVVWYGAALQPTAAVLIDAFKKKYPGMEVDYLRLDGGQIYDRYLTEIRANQPSADVFLSSTTAPIIDWDRQGLLMEYHSPEEPAYKDVKFPLAQPGKWLPWQILVWGPSYRTDLVKTPIKTWADAPKVARDLKLPIAEGNVVDMEPAQHVLYTLRENFGDTAVQIYKDLGQLKPRLFEGHADIQAQQNAGEVPIVFHMVSKTAFDAIAKGAPVTWVVPPEGVPADGYATCVMAKAPHPNAGKLFYNFLLSEEGQTLLLKTENSYSVRPGLTPPPGLKVPYSELKILPWDYQKEIELTPQYIKEWQTWTLH